MKRVRLVRGWRLRTLLAASAGMAIALALAWSEPPSYVATGHVAVDEQHREAVLTSPWRTTLSERLGIGGPSLHESVSLAANGLGEWVTVSARHRSAADAAFLANAAAAALVDATGGMASVLTSAEPPTTPVQKVPQGMALLGGLLALAVAVLAELGIASIRPVVSDPAHAAAQAKATLVHVPEPETVVDRMGDQLYAALRIEPWPIDVVVSASSPYRANMVAAQLTRQLRAAGRSARAAHADPESALPHPYLVGSSKPDFDRVWALPTLEPDVLAAWAPAVDRVIVAIDLDDTPRVTLRSASSAIARTGRSVDAVVATDRRPRRRAVAPEESQWCVMD